jgi:hypothetical protein
MNQEEQNKAEESANHKMTGNLKFEVSFDPLILSPPQFPDMIINDKNDFKEKIKSSELNDEEKLW